MEQDSARAAVLDAVVTHVSAQLPSYLDEIRHDVSLHDLGLDSLDEVELTMDVEEEFEILISDEDRATHFKSINTITDYILTRLE